MCFTNNPSRCIQKCTKTKISATIAVYLKNRVTAQIQGMIQASTYKMPQYILDKLLRLLDLHKIEKEKFERAAYAVTNRQYRDTICNLAQESNQYICELASQLRSLGVEADIGHHTGITDVGYHTEPAVFSEPNIKSSLNIFQSCKESEKLMISAYREMLNEPFLAEGLRALMRYQLNGIMYTFLRLKLLM